jgi:hypothetical protein
MRKIKLQLESLAVESFQTLAAEQAAGTVVGQQRGTNVSCPASCINSACTCPGITDCGGATCEGSCAGYTCSCYCTLEPTFCQAC